MTFRSVFITRVMNHKHSINTMKKPVSHFINEEEASQGAHYVIATIKGVPLFQEDLD